jgi:hypothetical protein
MLRLKLRISSRPLQYHNPYGGVMLYVNAKLVQKVLMLALEAVTDATASDDAIIGVPFETLENLRPLIEGHPSDESAVKGSELLDTLLVETIDDNDDGDDDDDGESED